MYKNKWTRGLITSFDTIGYFLKKILFFLKKKGRDRVNRILICKLDHAGDLLLATPAIRSIRERFPQAHVTFVVGPWAKNIVEGEDYIDETISYRAYWHDRSKNRRLNIHESIDLIKNLRQGKYDIFFDLKGDLFAIIIAALSGIPRRIGYGWAGGGFLLTDEVKTTIHKHQVEILMDAARTIGIAPDTPEVYMSISENDKKYAYTLLKERGWEESLLTLGFHVGSGCPSKNWPIEYYADLMERLARDIKVQIVLVGGADDMVLTGRLEERLSFKPINIAGKATFKQTAAAIKRCAVFIGNDSGPVHMAAAVGIPTIVIFSAANDWCRWKPYGDNVAVVYKDVPCKECEKATCDSMECMTFITVDEIFDLVLDKSKTQDNRI